MLLEMNSVDVDYILSSNVIVSVYTILVWDYVITLQDEVNGIWLQPWTIGSGIFFVNRYLPFIDMGMALYMNFRFSSPQLCQAMYKFIISVTAVGLSVSETVILLKTWAMYHKSKTLGFYLLGLSIATYCPGFYVAYREMHILTYRESPPGTLGCRVLVSSRLIVVPWFLLLASQTSVIILTMLKGKDHLLRSRRSWVKEFYQQGLIFYALLATLLVINIVVALAIKPEPHFKQWISSPLRAFHAVFASRVILHISKTQVEESRFENDFLSTVQFSMRKTETSSQIFLPTRLSEDELTELDHDIFSSRQQKFPSTSISIDP